MYVSIKSLNAPEPRVEQPPAYIDNPFAPEIFTTGCAGMANNNGIIVMTLESARCDHRLALTTAAAIELVSNLNDFLEQQGLSPSKMLADGATFQ